MPLLVNCSAMHVSHASQCLPNIYTQCLPDVILCWSFTRPSTALAVIEGLGTECSLLPVNCSAMHVSHASQCLPNIYTQCLPDVILCRSFTRPFTALAVIEGPGMRLVTDHHNHDTKHFDRGVLTGTLIGVCRLGLHLAYWLKHWTVDQKGSRVPVPLAAEIYFSSGCTQPYPKN